MQSLTKADLIRIHDDLVKITGEEYDILSEVKLTEIVDRHEKSKNLVRKAAILLHDTPNFQPFSEGNKRTAFSSFKVFMELNGLEVKVSNNELEDIILRSVNNNITLRDVEKWLKKNLG